MTIEIDKTYMDCFGDLPKRRATHGVVIHHTCTATPKRTRSALKSQGYSTHFEVDRDGHVYQYARLDRQCSHCSGANWHCVGVDLTHPAGAEWPQVQLDAAAELFRWLSAKLEVPLTLYEDFPRGFWFHRALCNTVCPQNFPGGAVFAAFAAEADAASGEGEDFDCLNRLRDVLRICLADGKKKEAQELAKQLLGL